MKAFAVILAAGRGSRMHELTAARPKCLLELAGSPLLFWQEKALNAAGIENIHLVKGYLAESLPARFTSSLNPRWHETNMLASLLCANEHISSEFARGMESLVVSYADIVYSDSHIKELLADPYDISLTYDTAWEELWSLRFANVLDDAETFRQMDGRLLEIGGKPRAIDEICGQYMGLLKFSARGWQRLLEIARSLGPGVDKTDMTAFLRLLLGRNIEVGAVAVAGGWCEADNPDDLRQYENALARGAWRHDWRNRP